MVKSRATKSGRDCRLSETAGLEHTRETTSTLRKQCKAAITGVHQTDWSSLGREWKPQQIYCRRQWVNGQVGLLRRWRKWLINEPREADRRHAGRKTNRGTHKKHSWGENSTRGKRAVTRTKQPKYERKQDKESVPSSCHVAIMCHLAAASSFTCFMHGLWYRAASSGWQSQLFKRHGAVTLEEAAPSKTVITSEFFGDGLGSGCVVTHHGAADTEILLLYTHTRTTRVYTWIDILKMTTSTDFLISLRLCFFKAQQEGRGERHERIFPLWVLFFCRVHLQTCACVCASPVPNLSCTVL